VFGEAEPHWLEQEGDIIAVYGDSPTGKSFHPTSGLLADLRLRHDRFWRIAAVGGTAASRQVSGVKRTYREYR
jgi:hypothetical protein